MVRAACCVLHAVCCVLCAVCCVLCAACCVLCVVCCCVLLCAAASCAPKRCWSLVGTPPSREVCWHPVGPSVVALPHAHTGTPSDARVWLAPPLHARCVSVPWDCLLWPYPNHTMTSRTTPEFGRQEERLQPLLVSFTILNKPQPKPLWY